MLALPPALAPMGAFRQFLCYVLVPSKTKPGKMDKFPMSPHTGRVVDAHDPAAWTTAEHACSTAAAWGAGYGVAFSFQESDPFFFVDIDGCRDDAGNWSQVAQHVASMFPGAAMEVSQSGRGLHIFGVGQAPAHGKKNEAYGLEFYTERRFVALTGMQAVGNASTDHTPALHALTAQFFPPTASADGVFELTAEPVPEWRGPVDDADLIRRALASRSAASAFGAKASFADLWEGNVEVLARAFPSSTAPFDGSSADAALVAHLAFWTGRHGERMERLMRQSKLVREKWNREDYLPRTICEILARSPGDVLADKPPEPPATVQAQAEAPQQRVVEGNTFLSPAAQIDLFKGCVYVKERHRVLVPGGALVKPEQFKAIFGGYVFAMDTVNERTTRNAWEAFSESQALRSPHADSICFKPDRLSGEIIKVAGKDRVNTYWPATVARTVGDVGPFMAHLRKVLPDERDQTILLSYMAACVQHKGVKFPWAPVLQGCEGNGKTLFSACVAEAVGQHFTHWPHASDLDSPFNGWVANKLLIAVEELFSQEHQAEIVEKLKTLITGGMGIQIQFKGVDQESMSICANFMVTTNYKTAIRKTPDNARRFGMFYSAQQSYADLVRDNMTGDYFPRLYAWLRGGGYAVVSELLHTYPIQPEFNPADALHRAPVTSTTEAAIVESRGGIEQQIAEAIAQDTPGFMGGWVSSIMLDRLLNDTLKVGGKLTLAKRREMLQSMGYVLHPGLPDGRVNNPVQPDQRKPQLFIRQDHAAVHMRGAADIARAYTAAQTINPTMRAT